MAGVAWLPACSFNAGAGGQSTCALSVSPAAKGLFLRSIVQSGACTGRWSPGLTAISLEKSSMLASVLKAPTEPQ
jgi:carboxylesterase type B